MPQISRDRKDRAEFIAHLNAVSHAADGLNKCRSEFSAKASDEDFNGVRIAIEVLRIDVFGQFALRNDPPAMMHEIGQHTEFMAGQFHDRPVSCDFRGSRIQCDGSTLKFGNDLPGCTANQGTKSCEDFFHSEWLGHVIVRAAVDALDFFVPASSCRQDKDGHSDTRFAPSSKDRESVDLRQTQVQQCGIVGFRLPEKIRSLAVYRRNLPHIRRSWQRWRVVRAAAIRPRQSESSSKPPGQY